MLAEKDPQCISSAVEISCSWFEAVIDYIAMEIFKIHQIVHVKAGVFLLYHHKLLLKKYTEIPLLNQWSS